MVPVTRPKIAAEDPGIISIFQPAGKREESLPAFPKDISWNSHTVLLLHWPELNSEITTNVREPGEGSLYSRWLCAQIKTQGFFSREKWILGDN